MKTLVCLMALLAFVSVASGANLVTNGGFETGDTTGWVKWGPAWGSGDRIITTNTTRKTEGVYGGRIQITNGEGSFGMYQVVDVPTTGTLDFSTWVRATTNSVNWAEVIVYNYAVTNVNDIDDGGISKPFAIWKRDSWTGYAGVPGGTLPTVATSTPPGDSWEKVTTTLNNVASGKVTIAYKWGRSGGGFSGSMYVDDVVLTPEPATLLLLALPLVFIRRRVH